MTKLPFLIGRAMFGGFFLYNGLNHFIHADELRQYAGAKHLPMPDLAVKASGVMLMIGGASIILGLKPKYGAAAVIAFLAAVSPSVNNFWADEDPNQRQQDIIHFAKNMALAGGALALAGLEEPWPASVSPSGAKSGAKDAKDRAKITWKALAA